MFLSHYCQYLSSLITRWIYSKNKILFLLLYVECNFLEVLLVYLLCIVRWFIVNKCWLILNFFCKKFCTDVLKVRHQHRKCIEYTVIVNYLVLIILGLRLHLTSTTCSNKPLNDPKLCIKRLLLTVFFSLSSRSTVGKELLDLERDKWPASPTSTLVIWIIPTYSMRSFIGQLEWQLFNLWKNYLKQLRTI